jgi:uncharacterized protein with ParB-like and HNH nuclease domain
MRSNPRTVFDLYGNKVRYIIPLFQRHYVWNLERQWKPLWKDVKDKAGLRLTNNEQNRPHFVGAIVIENKITSVTEVKAYDIIDGQQRLTTFQVLLAALRDIAFQYDCTDIGEELDRYLSNTGMLPRPDVDKYKIWPSKIDRAPLCQIISARSPHELDQAFPNGPTRGPQLVRAYHYFYSSIRSYIDNSEPPLDADKCIRAFFYAVGNDFQVVEILLDPGDNAHMIFETLNARGQALLQADLVRNFIFLRVDKSNEDPDRLYEQYWENFEHSFWDFPEKRGKNYWPRLELFMQHFVTYKKANEVKFDNIFDTYREWISTERPYSTIESELNDLNTCANVVRFLIEPAQNTRLGRLAAHLKAFDISTVYPLIIFLITDANLQESELSGIFTDLESYLVRRMVCDRTSKNYNKFFLQILQELRKKTSSREALRVILLRQTSEVADWPDDNLFLQAFLQSKVYTALKPISKLEFILKEIEIASRTQLSEDITINSRLSIEHIMPQKWENTWPLSNGQFVTEQMKRDAILFSLLDKEKVTPELEETNKRYHLSDTFGNLTLLTTALNSSVSNSVFSTKKPLITAQSALWLNRYFQTIDSWNVNSIITRGLLLFEVAKKVWPYPV